MIHYLNKEAIISDTNSFVNLKIIKNRNNTDTHLKSNYLNNIIPQVINTDTIANITGHYIKSLSGQAFNLNTCIFIN